MTAAAILTIVVLLLGLAAWFLRRRSVRIRQIDRRARQLQLDADRQKLQPEAQRRLAILRNADVALNDTEFISQAELKSWQFEYHEALGFVREPNIAGVLPPADRDGYWALCKRLSEPSKRVLELNERFVRRRLTEDSAQFDRIEKYPLTANQRRAIITSEDATLIIAGAGTGKTSTIVGKIDYLLRHQLATPEQILVLAFNKQASEELRKRIAPFDPHAQIPISTFHALGYRVVGEVEGRLPPLSKLAEDQKLLNRFVRDRIQKILTTSWGQLLITKWFSVHLDEPYPPDPTSSADEIIRRERSLGLRAINGAKMNSRQEVKIANWLTLSGIEWEYERSYPVDVATPWKRQYQPDFYLPKYDLYLEHFGIGCDGSTALQIDTVKYKEAMQWKRDLHARNGTRLLETTSCDDQREQLISRLEGLLASEGVSARPLTQTEIDNIVAEANRPFSDFVMLICQFLAVFKGGGANFGMTRLRARSERDLVFLEIFEQILMAYEQVLANDGEIDFNDMLNRARGYIEQGRFQARFKYIVVDEFQDISENRLALLLALRAQVKHARLFVVGDDWQAIYRFTGSDISIITQLASRVGATIRVDLDETFRYRQELLDASAIFITKNPSQLKKQIRAHSGASKQLPISIILSSAEVRQGQTPEGLELALEDIARRSGQKGASVYILGRYNFSRPAEFWDLQNRWKQRNLDLDFLTAHSSKSKEADYVIVVGLEAGEYGFPSNVADDPIMKMVLSEREEYLYAEERRLFYVAITRARRHVFLLAPQDQSSTFVADDLLQPPLDAFTSVIGEISERHRCPRCGGSTIKRRNGQFGTFWSCTNYPSCRGKLPVCPRCRSGGLLEQTSGGQNNSYHCTDCGHESEQCPRCRNGFLVERVGKYGSFLACSEWKGGDGCVYTRDVHPSTRSMN